MSEQESPVRRRRIARILVAIFGVGGPAVGAGIVLFSNPPQVPTGFAPCHGDVCIACVQPTQAQCARLVKCGGEPCGDTEIVDGGVIDGGVQMLAVEPYQGAAGKLARGLRETSQRAGQGDFTFHSDVFIVDGGLACSTVLYMSRDARAAWLRTVDATAGGSEVVDCRHANLPGNFKRGTARRSVLQGVVPPDGTGEEDPDSTVGPLDAGPE